MWRVDDAGADGLGSSWMIGGSGLLPDYGDGLSAVLVDGSEAMLIVGVEWKCPALMSMMVTLLRCTLDH